MEKRSPSSQTILKITLIGPESSGKTFLCKILAKHYHTVYVPEYLRTYTQKNWEEKQEICQWKDLLSIIQGQLSSESYYESFANQLLFLDTNPLTLYVYTKLYFQKCPQEIKKSCQNRDNEFYLLTKPDIPWEFDVLRDRPHEREWIFYLFKQELLRRKLPFFVVSGNFTQRIKNAIHLVNQILKNRKKL